ncbi:hypothetical protein HN00_09040 [Limosilactobacillus reuteri]|nr:hypothetical protein HN00_09040 [Limosilactobacillus reuteri]
MAYNFRKEQKELYVPGKSPSLINVPAMKILLCGDMVILIKKIVSIKKQLKSSTLLLIPLK